MNIKTILVAIGGSPYSHGVLRYGAFFAKKFSAALLGIYVRDVRFVEGPWFTSPSEFLAPEAGFEGVVAGGPFGFVASERYFPLGTQDVHSSLDRRAEKMETHFNSVCRKEGVKGSFEIHTGLVSDVILETARKAELVIVGKKGEHATWLERHLGSASSRIIHKIDRPVLLMDRPEPKEIKRIVLSYAGGHFSEKALELTQYLIENTGLQLKVLTIGTEKAKVASIQTEARDYLDSRNIPADYVLATRDLEAEVKKVCEMEDTNMLITGASLDRSYEDFVSMTLANRVLYYTRIPVLFVR